MSTEGIKRRFQFGMPLWQQTRNKLLTVATPHFFAQYEPFRPISSHKEPDEEPQKIAQEVFGAAENYQIQIETPSLLDESPTPPLELPDIEASQENGLQECPEQPVEPLSVPLDSDMQLQEPWSLELLERYATLPLPPFYDVIACQEKVASELHRQNVLLQNTQQHSTATASALSGMEEQLFGLETQVTEVKESLRDIFKLLEDSDPEEPSPHEEDAPYPSMTHTPRVGVHQDARLIHLLERLEERLSTTVSPEVCLMDSLDALFQLLQATEKMAGDIMSLVPFTTGFLKSSKPNWRIQLEKILESHLEGMIIVRNKLLIALTELGITIIDAAPGDSFSPQLHKAVERISNGEHAGQISQLIRYGYMKDNIPLRYATVAVFY